MSHHQTVKSIIDNEKAKYIHKEASAVIDEINSILVQFNVSVQEQQSDNIEKIELENKLFKSNITENTVSDKIKELKEIIYDANNYVNKLQLIKTCTESKFEVLSLEFATLISKFKIRRDKIFEGLHIYTFEYQNTRKIMIQKKFTSWKKRVRVVDKKPILPTKPQELVNSFLKRLPKSTTVSLTEISDFAKIFGTLINTTVLNRLEKGHYLQEFAKWERDALKEHNNSIITKTSMLHKLPVSIENYEREVGWKDVSFSNGRVTVFINRNPNVIPEPRSKSIYNKFTKLIQKYGTLTVEVDRKTNKVVKCNAASIIDSVFDRLEIEQELSNHSLGKITYLEKIHSSWDNDRVIKAYRLRDKSEYFNSLCDRCPPNFKIVPVREQRSHDSSESIVEEDAFLFPVRRQQYTYILWESVEQSRATHVFRCLPENYRAALQNVFDYVVSPGVTNKRDRLRSSRFDYFDNSVVKHVGSVNHPADGVAVWKRNLDELTP